MRTLLVIVLLATLAGVQLKSQEPPESPLLDVIRAYYRANNQAPLVGEPFTVEVIVEIPPNAELIRFPVFADSWGDFVILEQGDIQQENIEESWVRYSQSLEALLWETGDFEPPETLVEYRLVSDIESYFVPFTPIFFTVPSVLNPDMNQNTLRPLKPQIGYFNIPPYLVVFVVCIVAVSGYWARYMWRKRRLKTEIVILPASPAEIAIARLNQVDISQMAAVWVNVAQILRMFLSAKFENIGQGLTTDEVLDNLQKYEHISTRLINELRRILFRADGVKFETTVPDNTEPEQLIKFAINWVLKVDDYIGESEEEPEAI